MLAVAPAGYGAEEGPATPEETFVSSRNPLVETYSEGDHLLGDWGGRRTRLFERGVHFQAGYIGEGIGNVSGGLEQSAIYQGLFEAALELDIHKLTRSWRGAFFRVSMIYPHGASPSRELTGDIQTLSNIDAYDSVNLYEFWLEQNFWHDRVSVRAGKLLADSEFATTDSGALFLNSGFGWPGFISGNTRNSGPTFFRSALGARLWVEPARGFYVQTGIYDGDTFENRDGKASADPNGIRVRTSGEQGMFGIAETGWRVNQSEDARGLPGAYKLGGWWHTSDFADQFDPAASHSGNGGVYAAIEQDLWREARNPQGFDQGLSAFLRAGWSPEDRSRLELTLDTGINYTGPFPGRNEDTFGIGVTIAKISDDYRHSQRAAGASVIPDYELALEVTYEFILTSWWSLQPDFQWIHHPGGSSALDDAFVVGLRSRVTF